MRQEITSLCSPIYPEHCQKWAADLMAVTDLKKAAQGKPAQKGKASYTQWCDQVYSDAASLPANSEPEPAVWNWRDGAVEPKNVTEHELEPLRRTHAESKAKAVEHYSARKAARSFVQKGWEPSKSPMLRAPAELSTTAAPHQTLLVRPQHLQDCTCLSREGHRECRCAGGLKTVDGALQQ